MRWGVTLLFWSHCSLGEPGGKRFETSNDKVKAERAKRGRLWTTEWESGIQDWTMTQTLGGGLLGRTDLFSALGFEVRKVMRWIWGRSWNVFAAILLIMLTLVPLYCKPHFNSEHFNFTFSSFNIIFTQIELNVLKPSNSSFFFANT